MCIVSYYVYIYIENVWYLQKTTLTQYVTGQWRIAAAVMPQGIRSVRVCVCVCVCVCVYVCVCVLIMYITGPAGVCSFNYDDEAERE